MDNISVTTEMITMLSNMNVTCITMEDLKLIQKKVQISADNADAFFLIINGALIYCKY